MIQTVTLLSGDILTLAHTLRSASVPGAGGVHTLHPAQHLRVAKDVPTEARRPRVHVQRVRVARVRPTQNLKERGRTAQRGDVDM